MCQERGQRCRICISRQQQAESLALWDFPTYFYPKSKAKIVPPKSIVQSHDYHDGIDYNLHMLSTYSHVDHSLPSSCNYDDA